MTEENLDNEPRSMGLRRGLWGKLLGIGLFVGLGTFAVSQSMKMKNESAASPSGTQAVAQDTSAATSATSPTSLPSASTNVEATPMQLATTAAPVTNQPTTIQVARPQTPEPSNGKASDPKAEQKPANAAAFKTTPDRVQATDGEQFSEPPKRTINLSSISPLQVESTKDTPPTTNPLAKQEPAANPSSFNPVKANETTSPATEPSGIAASLPQVRSFAPESNSPPPANNSVSPKQSPAGFQALSDSSPKSPITSIEKEPELERPAVESFSNRPNPVVTEQRTQENVAGLNGLPQPQSFSVNGLRSEDAKPATDSTQESAFRPNTPSANSNYEAIRDAFGSSDSTNRSAGAIGSPTQAVGSPGQEGPTAAVRRDTPLNQSTSTPTAFGNPVPTPVQANSSNPNRNQPPAVSRPLRQDAQLPTTAGLDRQSLSMASSATTLSKPGDSKLEGLQTPSLAIEKIAPEEIQLNQITKFKIAVRNVGKVTASDVIVSDRIPEGTQLIEADPPVTRQTPEGEVQWVLGELASGEERTISIDLKPTQPGEIGSVAKVSFASRAAMRTRVTRPLLEIEHTAPDRTMLGDPVPMKITVYNRGDGEAKDVLVQEAVPTQLEYNNNEFRDLEYPIGSIPPGQSREVTLNLKAANAGKFQNTVVAAAAGGLRAVDQINLEVIAPKLTTASLGPSRRFLKREATYEFAAANNGTASATNIDLVARLPRGLKFESANNLGKYNPSTHAVYWALNELKPGQEARVELTAMPVETGSQDFDFQAMADLGLESITHQALTVEHLVDVYFEIDDLVDHIEVGSPTQYEVRIVNQGTKPASNIRLSMQMENGIQPTEVDSPVDGEIRGQSVVFQPIANLNPGEEVKLIVTATGRAPGDHRVSAQLEADGREINLTKDESTRVYADR